MSNLVEEIFRLNVDTVEAIKNIQALAGSYNQITEAQRAQIVELKLLEEKEKQLTLARQKSLNPTTQIQLTKEIQANKKAVDELTKSVSLFADVNEDAKVEVNALGQSVSNAFKSTAVNAAIKDIKRLEDSAGSARKTGFNPLNNSINQLSRELPAFAVSANVGFLAISNNLPILFDALEGVNRQNAELAKNGEKTTSVLKQIGGAVFSFGSLLSIGVTLLTLYGGAIAKTVYEVISQTSAFELETKTLQILNDEFEHQIKLQEELQKATNNTNKEIAKLNLSDPGKALLDVADKATDKFQEIESGYTKAVSKAILTQIQLTEKEVDFATKRTKNAVEIENKKTGTIIRLNLEMNKVLGTYSAFYNKQIFTREEVALQAQLDKLNKAKQRSLALLNTQFNSEIDLISKKEAEKDKIRERFSSMEYIKQRDVLDQIEQLRIDNIASEQSREINQALFNNEKAVREIDLANEVEEKKLAIAAANYQEKKRIEMANEKDQRQLNFNLIKLNQDYSKEVQRIKAENIPKEQQAELRLRLEEELFRKLKEINDKYQKVIDDKIKDDINRTYKARFDTLQDNNNTELFILERKLKKEREKGDKANADELKALKIQIYEKKKLILDADEANELGGLKRNDNGEVNAAEKFEVETKYANKRKKLEFELLDSIAEKNKKHTKDLMKQYITYLADLIHAIIQATRQILDIEIKKVDSQISLQQKRVDEAKGIADRGNAELLELEQKRLDDLNKQREKYVRQQQGLAAIELVANTAIAVSKAAAQGGVAAGVTIAAALIALVAGLASARSIASQAAYYEGGYTGDGNPREESNTMGGKPASRSYQWHKGEFVMDHKKTRQFRDIFEDVHRGKIDLNDWKEKASMFDSMVSMKGFTTTAPMQAPSNHVTVIEFKGLQAEMRNVSKNIEALSFGLNVDEDGFTQFMAKRKQRADKIKNLAKL